MMPTTLSATALAYLRGLALPVAMALSMMGCEAGHHRHPEARAAVPASSPAVIPRSPSYRSTTWGFTIQSPPGWNVHRDFDTGYLANGAWKAFAGPQSRGTPVLALVLPGSNHVTSAQIRIGASREAGSLHRCTTLPDAARLDGPHQQVINGIEFTTFTAADAAMSHYLEVHGYRTVHAGACYAIDLLVYGTNPQVYDPPATPPFTRASAFTQLRRVLASFRFTGAADP